MEERTALASVVRQAGEGDRRWFFGGGEFTWKVGAAESGGEFLLWEHSMDQGKATPLHTHPADESMYVLEGELLVHVDGEQALLTAGGFVLAARGVPHAFKVVSETCRMLCLHTPGSCEAFYLGASEPLDGSARVADFSRVSASAEQHGGITLLGPPPFAG